MSWSLLVLVLKEQKSTPFAAQAAAENAISFNRSRHETSRSND
jgi:ribosomal protein S11